jgi:ABC-type transport system involved in multi-copper enzyme maturation permease subunit
MLNDNSDKDKVEYFYDIDIKDYVENMGVDLAVIFIIVVVVVHIFNEDYNSGTELMIKTSAYCRRKLYTNRLLCTLMASGFVGFLFPIIELITKYMSFDLKNTSASIRCLESMSESGMSISIKEYLVLSIVLRGISAIFLGIIVMCISKLTHNNIVCYVIAIALVYLPDIMYEHMGQFIKNISLCKGFAIYKAFKNVEKIFGLHNMIVWGMLYLIISLFIVSYFMYKSED